MNKNAATLVNDKKQGIQLNNDIIGVILKALIIYSGYTKIIESRIKSWINGLITIFVFICF